MVARAKQQRDRDNKEIGTTKSKSLEQCLKLLGIALAIELCLWKLRCLG